MTNIIDLYNRRVERRTQALLDNPAEGLVNAARRSLLAKSAALGSSAVGTAAALMAPTTAKAQTLTDADVLTFALNLEYLEAEFYLRATTGAGLPANLIGANPGAVNGGRAVTFTTPVGRTYANEIAADEMNHVAFLRSALSGAGVTPVDRPTLDISTAFATLFNAAGLGTGFDPYASENNFLLGAFVFEDVGVTAYKGASPLISNATYLSAAAGILAVEAYHAGLIRTVLYSRGASTVGMSGTADLRNSADKIAAARDSVDGASNDDQGISPGQDPNVTDTDVSNIVPTDAFGVAYSRTAGEVLNVVYLNVNGGAVSSGGFFPNGMNGNIKTSTAN